MNDSFYEQYYKKGGTYEIPIEIFNQLIGEVEDKENLIKYLEDKIEECYRSGDCRYLKVYQDISERIKSGKYDN